MSTSTESENTVADGNVECKRIDSNLRVSLIIFKNLQLNCILRYINDSIHLKDLEISKYKRESKARMPIKFCCFKFVNCCLIWLFKH